MDFRGQGESGLPATLEDEKVAGTMERHAMDVQRIRGAYSREEDVRERCTWWVTLVRRLNKRQKAFADRRRRRRRGVTVTSTG